MTYLGSRSLEAVRVCAAWPDHDPALRIQLGRRLDPEDDEPFPLDRHGVHDIAQPHVDGFSDEIGLPAAAYSEAVFAHFLRAYPTVPPPFYDVAATSWTPQRRALTVVAPGNYVCAMRAVGLKVLNDRLSEYVRLAAAGETVLVTDRDPVVAEIVPPRTERSPVLANALLADAVRKGWLTPPAVPGTGPAPAPAPVMTLDQLLMELDEDGSDQ